jgi:DHA2 family multidrug resistance protein
MPPAAVVRPAANKWLIALAVTFGTLMGAIDSSIVNVAIPHMRGSLGASIDEITWVSTGYIVANVIIMPLTAWLGGRFGRKRVYMFCLTLFLVGSIFCGMARSLPTLVFFRVLQGIGAGALIPTEQAILRETFPLEEQGLAMGLYGLAVMIGPAVGPTLGGWITDNYSWPWIFYVNIPVGIVGLLMVQRFVHDPPHLTEARARGERQAGDYTGILLLSLGLGCMQFMLERGDREDWFQSHLIVGLAAVGAIAMAFFIWRELTTEKPAVDLSILKNGSFSAGTFVGGMLGIALFGSLFMLPLFFQELLGYSATQSGLELMPRTLVMLAMMPIAGMLFNRLGAKPMILAGLGIAGGAAWAMSHFSLESSQVDILLPQMVQGAGFSMMFVALSTATLAAVPRDKMTNATGLYNVVRNLGGSLGTVVIATLFERYQVVAHSALQANVSIGNPLAQQRLQMIQGGLSSKLGYLSNNTALGLLDGGIQRQATMLAFDKAFATIALLFFIGLPFVFLLKEPSMKSAPGEHVMAE